MSLEQWLSYGQLVRHKSSAEEIAGLMALADRDIANAQLADLSPDWRLNIAYNAALQAAKAALAAAGYRAEREAHHYRVIQSLEHTVGLDAATIGKFDRLRKKRNTASYESAGSVSIKEADEMLGLARDIRFIVAEWLREDKPELV